VETIHPLNGHTRKIAGGLKEDGKGRGVKSFIYLNLKREIEPQMDAHERGK
jgi:hypothetical protein